MNDRICKGCGFIIDSRRSGNARYCSSGCKDKYLYKLRHKHRAEQARLSGVSIDVVKEIALSKKENFKCR